MSDKKRLRPETFDYFLAGLSPIFVIGMIGSLVYFLVCVLYRGSFPIRLMWVLGLYTVASVLIARIAMEKSRSYSLGYMTALGAATLIATPAYMSTGSGSLFGGMLLVAPLLVLIAVLADRITFDCTSMNEDIESNGIGLLQSLGVTRAEQFKETRSLAQKAVGASLKMRRHNPGVWILYFALGAIPLFALGQLIAVDPENRAFAWKMVFAYLFCSLSLLVLISLLSLRKYLRDRNVEMDSGLASRWIVYGVSSSLVLLIVLFLIPLPSKSIFQTELPFRITQKDNLSSSRFGWGNEGVDDKNPNSPQAESGEQNTDPNDRNANGQEGESSPSSSTSDNSSKTSRKKDSGSSEQNSSSGSEKQKGKDADSKNPNEPTEGENKSPNDPADGQGEQRESKEPSESDGSPAASPNQSKQLQAPNQAPRKSSWSLQWNPGTTLQWMAMLAIVAVACFYAYLHRKEIIAFINRWLGYGRREESRTIQPTDTLTASTIPPLFSTLDNPFAVRGLSREQMVTKLFQALETWGFEKRIKREDEETPDEYVKRIGKRFPEQHDNLKRLGFLYSRIAYARGRVSEAEVKGLQPLWSWLVATSSQSG